MGAGAPVRQTSDGLVAKRKRTCLCWGHHWPGSGKIALFFFWAHSGQYRVSRQSEDPKLLTPIFFFTTHRPCNVLHLACISDNSPVCSLNSSASSLLRNCHGVAGTGRGGRRGGGKGNEADKSHFKFTTRNLKKTLRTAQKSYCIP